MYIHPVLGNCRLACLNTGSGEEEIKLPCSIIETLLIFGKLLEKRQKRVFFLDLSSAAACVALRARTRYSGASLVPKLDICIDSVPYDWAIICAGRNGAKHGVIRRHFGSHHRLAANYSRWGTMAMCRIVCRRVHHADQRRRWRCGERIFIHYCCAGSNGSQGVFFHWATHSTDMMCLRFVTVCLYSALRENVQCLSRVARQHSVVIGCRTLSSGRRRYKHHFCSTLA